jgi:hypothetical protein
MPLRNRVTPLGELIATSERGLVYANRGCLHNDQGEIRRRYNGKRWIACQLEFRGWQRPALLMPGRFTELFFLDEATAMAAGHRPCALCRHADYDQLTEFWSDLHPGQQGADAIDAQLHDERVTPRTGERRLHPAPLSSLPDGAFVLRGGKPYLVLGQALLDWSPAGYISCVRRSRRETATVITPPSLVELLRTEREPLVPLLHPSAAL